MENSIRKISISNDSLVMDIKNSFNLFYPFLSIEFSSNAKGIFSFMKHKLELDSNISKITHLANTINVDVSENKTVAEVERDFKELSGLQIKVYRKSGKVWNEISLTDGWTLKSQNKAGEFISTEMAAAS